MDPAKTMIVSGLIMGALGIPQHGEEKPVPHAMEHQEDGKEAVQNQNSLFAAIHEGRYEEAYQLIDSGADIHHIDPVSGKSVLALAAELGKKKLVWKLMNKGANPDQYCPQLLHWTPLFFAVRNNQINTARVLLGNGATVDARDNHGDTALMIAVQMHAEGQRDTKMIELLLARKADPVASNAKGHSISSYTQTPKVQALLHQAQRLRESGN